MKAENVDGKVAKTSRAKSGAANRPRETNKAPLFAALLAAPLRLGVAQEVYISRLLSRDLNVSWLKCVGMLLFYSSFEGEKAFNTAVFFYCLIGLSSQVGVII